MSTRVGTKPDGTLCGGHKNAIGLRLYYDAASHLSGFDSTMSPAANADEYLYSDGTARSATGPGVGVTSMYTDANAPVAAPAKCLDAGVVTFADGNAWSIIDADTK